MAQFDIAIAGEINLDLILYGLPEVMELERELLATGFTVTLGSSSAIVAHNLAALGCRVGFVSRVGDDDFGRIALERLARGGVDLKFVVQAKGRGSGVTVILPHGKERHILTYPGTIFDLTFEDLNLEYLFSARHFHMSSLFLQRGLAGRIPELFERAKRAGLSTSLDTNDDPEDLWRGPLADTLPFVDVLLPNEREAMKMAGCETAEAAVAWLSERVPLVVVKHGARGASAVSRGQRYEAAALRVDVVDTVGAGDSFDAGFLSHYVRGSGVEECLRWGNLAGAFSVTASGGTEAFRDREKLAGFLGRHSS